MIEVDRVMDEDPVDLWTSEFYAGVGVRLKKQLTEQRDLLDPTVVDLLKNALAQTSESYYDKVFRRYELREKMRLFFERFDLLIAPATPCAATVIGAERMTLNGVDLPVRPNLGLLTQPISLIGLPVAVAPLWCVDGLPMGVQLIAPPWREDLCLRAARVLEQSGIASSPISEICQ